MNAQQWITEFDLLNSKFKWFFIEYGFAKSWFKIVQLREEINQDNIEKIVFQIKTIMNDVWFGLPDSVFNIMDNPRGWSEFLSLIEE